MQLLSRYLFFLHIIVSVTILIIFIVFPVLDNDKDSGKESEQTIKGIDKQKNNELAEVPLNKRMIDVEDALVSILTPPLSQNVTVLQGQITMSCEALAEELIYYINNESGDLQSVKNNGFIQHILEDMGQGKLKRELTVYLTKEMAGKNFMIFCRGFNYNNPMPVDSDTALLQVAGPLNKPEDLAVTYRDSYLLLSWTPPPTLFGTDILGYNITVNNQNYPFTENTQVHVNYSDFSPCDSLDVEISAYNGVDGQPATPPTQYIPSNPANDVYLPVNTSDVTTEEDNEYYKLLLTVNVSSLDCEGQRPSHIHVSVSSSSYEDTENPTKYKPTLVKSDSSDKILVSQKPIEVKKDKEYYILVEFSNPLGVFQSNTNFYLCLIPEKDKKHIVSLTSCNSGINPTSMTVTSNSTSQSVTRPTLIDNNNAPETAKSSKILAFLIMLFTIFFF